MTGLGSGGPTRVAPPSGSLLWHCGSDGEWHFGTVTTDLVKHAPVAIAGPVAIAPPVLAR